MSSRRSYSVECNGRIYRVPVKNEYDSVLQFTKEIKKRFEFPADITVRLYYRDGLLHEDDCLYDLNLNTTKTPIRVVSPLYNANRQYQEKNVSGNNFLWRIMKGDRSNTPMIDDHWNPSLKESSKPTKRIPRSHMGTDNASEFTQNQSRRILIESSPLLMKRLPCKRTLLRTPKEISISAHRKRRAEKLEEQSSSCSTSESPESSSPLSYINPTNNSIHEESRPSHTLLSVKLTGLWSTHVLQVPYDATIRDMIDLFWRWRPKEHENHTYYTHDLFLFNHRTHIYPEIFDELVREVILLTPELATTHFYFYITKIVFDQDPYKRIKCYDEPFQNSAWRNELNSNITNQARRSQSVFLISMHLLQCLFQKRMNNFDESSFFDVISKYIFLPAIIALRHVLGGTMFLFELSLVADAFEQLFSNFSPSDLLNEYIGDLTPVFVCWLLEQSDSIERSPHNHESFQRVLLDDIRLSNKDLISSNPLFDPFEYLVYEYYRSHSIARQKVPRMTNEEVNELTSIMATKYLSFASLLWSARRTNENDELNLYQSNDSSFYFTGDGQNSCTKNRRLKMNKNSGGISLIFNRSDINKTQNKILVILLDISRSMFDKHVFNNSELSVFDVSKDMLTTLKNHLHTVERYALGLTVFGEFITPICSIVKDHEVFKSSVDNLKPEAENWTCLYDAIAATIDDMLCYEDKLSKETNTKKQFTKNILCLSDGINNHSNNDIESLTDLIKKNYAIIDFISFLPEDEEKKEDSKRAIEEIENLCQNTGGRYYRNLPELTTSMKDLFVKEAVEFYKHIYSKSSKISQTEIVNT